MIYITKTEWNKIFIPKLTNEKEFCNELTQLKKINNILIQIISLIIPQSLNILKQNILYSSMIYYYKYILYNNISHSEINQIKKIIICTSCILLSLKQNNIKISIDYLTKDILSLINSNSNKKYLIEEINNYVSEIEYNILYTIGFNMAIDNPYTIFKPLKVYLEQKGIEKMLLNEIFDSINDYIINSILFPFYLYYTSYDIAISCIQITKNKYKYNFIDIDDFIKINKIEVDKNNIEECSNYIIKVSEDLNRRSIKEEKGHTNNENSYNNNSNNIGNNGNNNDGIYLHFDIIRNIKTN